MRDLEHGWIVSDYDEDRYADEEANYDEDFAYESARDMALEG